MTYCYWTYRSQGWNIDVMTTKTSAKIQSVRNDLRDRRQARTEYRALKSALASYNSPADIDDLLLVAEAEGENTEAVRDILATNLSQYHTTHRGDVPWLRYSA